MVDRIGKSGLPPGLPSVEGAKPTEGADKPFALGRTNEVAKAEKVDAASALARLRAGEIDVEGYVDLKVDEATHGLKGLGKEQLADLRSLLREQLVSDPALVDLVKTATGQEPSTE